MREKPERKSEGAPLGGLAIATIAAPALVVCCAAPALVASVLAALGAWLGQRPLTQVGATAVAGGLIAYGIVWWRRRRRMASAE